MLHCAALCCSVLHCVADEFVTFIDELMYVAHFLLMFALRAMYVQVCCSVLQCVAVWFSMMQCMPMYFQVCGCVRVRVQV